MDIKKNCTKYFLDFTIEGERVITKKEFETTEDGRRYLSKKARIIQETGEVLEEFIYDPNSKKSIYRHISRSYMLN